MSAHTPGPWRWSDRYTMENGGQTWSLVGASGYGILSCDGVGNSPQGLGDEANARLIAAAPELLAHLQFAVKILSAIPAIGSTAQVDAMRAAIAKATGEEK